MGGDIVRILAVGDIVASDGREYIYNNLNRIREKYKIDFCVANGENAATTNGINKDISDMLTQRGVDVITMGNHTFANKGIIPVLENNERVIRPVNYPPETEGAGYVIQDIGYARIAVINAMGRLHMDPMDCPFRATERVLREIEGKADVTVIDFHAETTSEKLAFGNYFDGKVNIIFGTHTHVQTADEHVLPGGTAYITDVGMTGVMDSVLGVKKDIIMNMYYTRKRYRFEKAEGIVWFNGAVFDVDHVSGKVNSIERLRFSRIEG